METEWVEMTRVLLQFMGVKLVGSVSQKFSVGPFQGEVYNVKKVVAHGLDDAFSGED